MILLRVDDIDEFLMRFSDALNEKDVSSVGISHIFPLRSTFDFSTREDLEAKARDVALGLAPEVALKTFHVRTHRRGLKGQISS